MITAAAAWAVVTPYAHYRMGDGSPSTNGGNNLPFDASGNARHMAGSASGTPAITNRGGPKDDAFYTFNGVNRYFFGTVTPWNPPEDNVGVEAWVRTSNLSQTNRNVFGTGNNTVGLNLGFDANGGIGWFGAVASKAFAGSTGTSGYSAGTWIHIAAVRSAGVTTFYANGVASGTTTAVPNDASGAGVLHMAANSGGALSFEGDIAEARVFTFAAGAFDPSTDLLMPPVPSEIILEKQISTTSGTTYLARFDVKPLAGESAIPRLQLKIEGASQLGQASLLTSLPSGSTGVPYVIRFTADATNATLRFSTLYGDAATAGHIADLRVAEPLTAVPATIANARQRAQINRRYGMFLHYGINTFHDEEWTDGTKPVSSYQPTGLDVEQWVRTAYEAGMRYVLIISKHHDGFCLWNSQWTDYDVGSAEMPADVIAAAAAACKKYDMGLALYYSLWDRHEPTYANDDFYNQYMLRQLSELLGNYGPICELWLDGGWDKANSRWPTAEIYDLARRLQPDCQVSVNWTIGTPGNSDQALVLPTDQQEGYPFRYFPSDFRLGDPYLPKFPDPKIFSHQGQSYYLPFEATITLSSQNHWFFNTKDLVNKSVDQLAGYYYAATAQDNILVLNAPPDRSGKVRDIERNTLLRLRDKLGLSPGAPLPKNLTGSPAGSASAVWENNLDTYGPQRALDGDPETRWASGPAGVTNGFLVADFGETRVFNRMFIDEFEQSPGVGRISAFRLQSWNAGEWQTFFTGTVCGRYSIHNFPTQSTSKVRLLIDSSSDAPSIWEFQIHSTPHAFSTWRDQHFPEDGTSNPACAWDGDPDGDGRINLFEFAIDDDPVNPDSPRNQAIFHAEQDGSDGIVFTTPVRTGAVFTGPPSPTATVDGIVYRMEGSYDLDSFAAPLVEVSPETSGMPPLDSGWTYRSFRHSGADIFVGFFRVQLDIPGE